MRDRIDEIDARILEILQESGRTSLSDIAEDVGLSVPSVSDRVHKLEDQDVITGYHARVNAKRIHRDITAFIRLHAEGSENYDEIVREAAEVDDVLELGRLDSGHAKLRIERFQLSEFVRDIDDESLLEHRREAYEAAIRESFKRYRELLDHGVAPENARMVLPIGTKVNMVMSMNARMLMHVADMRAAADSQWEIREMTERVLDLAEEWCPITFEYYNDHLKGRKNRLAP